jgi:hypothetical protein
MNEQTEVEKLQGTYCLHCGEWIVLPAAPTSIVPQAQGAAAAPARDASFAYVVLWCSSCHKEAPYLHCDLMEQKDSPTKANPPVRSSSIPWGHGMVLRRGHAA